MMIVFFSLSSSIANCCPGRNNCVTMGAGSGGVTVFPREAMYFQQPYPFGLDPVSILLDCYNYDIVAN